jgi:hypothetical protein
LQILSGHGLNQLSRGKDAPVSRVAQPVDSIQPIPLPGGLDHHYVRIRFAAGTTAAWAPETVADGRARRWGAACM